MCVSSCLSLTQYSATCICLRSVKYPCLFNATWWQRRYSRKQMATIHLKPPEPFPFHKPDKWTRWKKRFQQFRIALGLSSAGEVQLVSTLLYCLGKDAEDVLQPTNATVGDTATYNGVCDLTAGRSRRERLLNSTSSLYILWPTTVNIEQ